jgi:tetratricopeptide (TPR) repeat protein
VLPPDPPSARAEPWIAELVADELPRSLTSLGVPAVSRAERLQAQAALEIPLVPLSRATSIRVAEALGADRLVTGTYTVEDGKLTLSLRLLDIERATLSAPLISSGPLEAMADLVDGLAWDIALTGSTPPKTRREDLAAARPKVAFEAWKLYGRALAARDPKARITALRRVVVLAPAFDSARWTLGQLLLEQREFSAAYDALGRVSARSPLERNARFLQGVALLEIGRYREAATLYTALADALPSPGVLNNLALAVLRDAPGPRRPSDFLGKAVELDPESTDLAFNLAWSLLAEGDAEAAAVRLRALARQAPLDKHVRVLLAWALRKAGHTQEAEQEWKAVLALAPTFATLTTPDLARRFERILPAERPFASGRETRSDAEVAASLLAKAQRLFEAGDLQGALPEATRAAYLDPYSRSIHLFLARLYRAQKDPEMALNEFRMALWSADDADVRVEVAALLRAMGRLPESRAEAEKALRLAPGNEAARRLAEKAQ